MSIDVKLKARLLTGFPTYLTCGCLFQPLKVTVFLSLAVTPVHPDLVHGDEVFGAEPALVLDLPVVDLVEVLQVLAPDKGLKVRTEPAFAVMEGSHRIHVTGFLPPVF